MVSRRKYIGGLTLGAISVTGCLDWINDDQSDFGTRTPTPLPTGEEPSDTTSRAQFQYDSKNSGVSEGIISDTVETRWRSTISPITSGGLSVSDERILVTASGSLYALDASDGDELWSVNVGADEGRSPAVSGDTAFVTSWNGGDAQSNGVVAIDLEDGRARWQAISDTYVPTPPTLADGRVYVGGIKYGEETTQSEVISIDATTGEERWRTPVDQERSEGVLDVNNVVTPAVENDVIFVGGGQEHLTYALDAEDGTELWRFEANDRVPAAPTVVDDTVYVGSRGGRTYSLDDSDGEELWSVRVNSGIPASIAATEDALYVPGDSTLTALTDDGNELWSIDTSNQVFAPTITENAVVVTEQRGDVYCLDPTNGTERWRREVRSRDINNATYVGVNCEPVVADEGVYVGSLGGDVYAFEH